jgi:hypothetical protein
MADDTTACTGVTDTLLAPKLLASPWVDIHNTHIPKCLKTLQETLHLSLTLLLLWYFDPEQPLKQNVFFLFFFFLTQFPLSIGVDNLCDASLASSWIFVPEGGGRPESVADTAEKQYTSYI